VYKVLILQLTVWKSGNIQPPVAGDQNAGFLLLSSNEFYVPPEMEKQKPHKIHK